MTVILRTPAIGPATWRPADFAGDSSWVHTVTPAQCTALQDALETWRRNGLGINDIDGQVEGLATFQGVFATLLRELADGRGFAVLRGLPIGRWTDQEAELVLWALGTLMGTGITQNNAGDLVGRVTDLGGVYGVGNVRAYQSRARLSFHNDFGEVVALMCVRKSKSGGQSYIASALTIYNELLAAHPDLVELLYEDFPWHRTGEEGPGESQFSDPRPIYSCENQVLSCRFARSKIDRAAREQGKPLRDAEIQAIDFIDKAAWRPDVALPMQLEPGDIQFLNNYTVLHTREAFDDWPEPERRRLLLRLWLEIPGFRPLGEKEQLMRFNRYGNIGYTPAGLRRRKLVTA